MPTTTKRPSKSERDLAREIYLILIGQLGTAILNAKDGEVASKLVHETQEMSRAFERVYGSAKAHGGAL